VIGQNSTVAHLLEECQAFREAPICSLEIALIPRHAPDPLERQRAATPVVRCPKQRQPLLE
jgi:hypothetical protein